MKLLGRTNGKQVCASIARHDYVSVGEGEDRIADDGGAILTNHYAGYSRGWGERIWFQVPQTFAELYSDYQFNSKDRKYGIWNIEDVRILPENEWPDVDSIEEKSQSFCWGTAGKEGKEKTRYVMLKDCPIEHLKSILTNVSHVSPETREVIEHLISKNES